MTPTARDLHMRREKGQALVRALHLSEMQAAGAARELALHDAEQQLDRIARRLPEALASGISLAEIARTTNVSRPTLYELRGRYSDDERDVRFAVLQTVAGRGPIDIGGVAEHLERPVAEIGGLVKTLLDENLIDEDFNDDAEEPRMELLLTDRGFGILESWSFDDGLVDEDQGQP